MILTFLDLQTFHNDFPEAASYFGERPCPAARALRTSIHAMDQHGHPISLKKTPETMVLSRFST